MAGASRWQCGSMRQARCMVSSSLTCCEWYNEFWRIILDEKWTSSEYDESVEQMMSVSRSSRLTSTKSPSSGTYYTEEITEYKIQDLRVLNRLLGVSFTATDECIVLDQSRYAKNITIEGMGFAEACKVHTYPARPWDRPSSKRGTRGRISLSAVSLCEDSREAHVVPVRNGKTGCILKRPV